VDHAWRAHEPAAARGAVRPASLPGGYLDDRLEVRRPRLERLLDRPAPRRFSLARSRGIEDGGARGARLQS